MIYTDRKRDRECFCVLCPLEYSGFGVFFCVNVLPRGYFFGIMIVIGCIVKNGKLGFIGEDARDAPRGTFEKVPLGTPQNLLGKGFEFSQR